MFDFSWSEIMVIGVVALVLIGPKDLPVAVRAITRVLKKMRRMAGEFQGHVDDMMREADLGEVQSTLRQMRGMNLKGAINRFVDADGSLGRAFEDPFATHAVPPVTPSTPPIITAPPPGASAPAFIPPGATRAASPPAFLPPGVAVPPDGTMAEDL